MAEEVVFKIRYTQRGNVEVSTPPHPEVASVCLRYDALWDGDRGVWTLDGIRDGRLVADLIDDVYQTLPASIDGLDDYVNEGDLADPDFLFPHQMSEVWRAVPENAIALAKQQEEAREREAEFKASLDVEVRSVMAQYGVSHEDAWVAVMSGTVHRLAKSE